MRGNPADELWSKAFEWGLPHSELDLNTVEDCRAAFFGEKLQKLLKRLTEGKEDEIRFVEECCKER